MDVLDYREKLGYWYIVDFGWNFGLIYLKIEVIG